jgi:hypothetical protein
VLLEPAAALGFGVIRRGGRRRHFLPETDERCGGGDDAASFTFPVPRVTDTETSAAATSLPRGAVISRAASVATTVAEKSDLMLMHAGGHEILYHDSGTRLHRLDLLRDIRTNVIVPIVDLKRLVGRLNGPSWRTLETAAP